MASDYAQDLHERRHRLLSDLVQQLLGIQDDDENYALALDFCLQKAYYHSFGDINPREVEAFYADLKQRLHADSQLPKAAALSALCSSVLAADLSAAGVPDHNHRLLLVLASLAGQPLHSQLAETPELLQLVYGSGTASAAPPGDKQQQQQQQAVAVRRFQRLLHSAPEPGEHSASAAGSSAAGSECELDPFGDDSGLSAWGDSEEEQQQDDADAWQQQQQQQQASGSSGASSPASPAAAVAAVDGGPLLVYEPPTALSAPGQLQPRLAVPGPHQLLARLSAARLARLPARSLGEHCFSEGFLAAQLLRLLQGQPAAGFVCVPAVDGSAVAAGGAGLPAGMGQRFEPDPRVTTPELSPRALAALMQQFATAGSQARQLRQLAQQLVCVRAPPWLCAAGAGGAAGEGGATPNCLRAAGVALSQQLDMMGCQAAQLQQQLQQQQHPLLRVRQQARPAMRRLRVLHAALFGVVQQLGSSSGGGPAASSAALLDGLAAAAAAAAAAASGPAGAADAAAVLHLLLSACVPLVAALAQWLWTSGDGGGAALGPDSGAAAGSDGSTAAGQRRQQSCCCDDFFIVRRAAVPATDSRFWHSAYGFSPAACSSSSSSSQDTGGASGSSKGSAAAGAGGVGAASVACPSFLLPLAPAIMTAGKSVRLLEYMEQEGLKTASSSSSSRRITSLSSSSRWAGGPGMMRAGSFAPSPERGASKAASRIHSVRASFNSRQPGAVSMTAMTAAAAAAAGFRVLPGGCRGSRVASARASSGSGDWAAAAADLSRQVRLQLAVAAATAGRQEQQQLPAGFISTACQLLQAHCSDQQQQQPPGGGVSGLMLGLLQEAAQQLAHPCSSLPGVAAAAAELPQTQKRQSLRDALLAVRAAAQQQCEESCYDRQPPPSANSQGQQQQQLEQQEQQLERQCGSNSSGEAAASSSPNAASVAAEAVGGDAAADELSPDSPRPAQPEGDAAAAAGAAADSAAGVAADAAADAAADSAAGVAPLLQWRAGLEGRLAAAGERLQQMAPRRGLAAGPAAAAGAAQPAGVVAGGAASGCGLLAPPPELAPPGCFTGSLAQLWPLKPLSSRGFAGLRGAAAAAAGNAAAGGAGDDGGSGDWLVDGQWPSHQLAWLLLGPPQQLVPLPLLLDQALLQPIQARVELVGSQLLSSLLGEWRLLQQLAGLVGLFLLASPAAVEWTYSCFAAVEAAAAAKRHTRPGGSTGGAAAGGAGVVLLGPEELDLVELELLLHEAIAAAPPDEPLPDPAAVTLSLNGAALSELRAARQAAAAAGGSAGGAGAGGLAATGGLWRCAGEWSGLACRHSGSWQLSLVYEPEELGRFSTAWRFLLQLRWVVRRLDSARHAACKGAAARVDMQQQDRTEAATVAAAEAAAAAGKGVLGASAPSSSGSGWLSSRQELLVLQEMGQLLARWQQYVMDRLIRNAWPELEQALAGASRLDEVRSAAATFLGSVSNLCGCRAGGAGGGRGPGGAWRHTGRLLGGLMDTALAAAAAADSMRELRRMTAAQAPVSGAQAHQQQQQAVWLELGAARSALAAAASSWRGQAGYLGRVLAAAAAALGADEDLEALAAALAAVAGSAH